MLSYIFVLVESGRAHWARYPDGRPYVVIHPAMKTTEFAKAKEQNKQPEQEPVVGHKAEMFGEYFNDPLGR